MLVCLDMRTCKATDSISRRGKGVPVVALRLVGDAHDEREVHAYEPVAVGADGRQRHHADDELGV